jgi:hypothetical protein
MKLAMNVGKDNDTQMTEMMENSAVDPNLRNHIDISEIRIQARIRT